MSKANRRRRYRANRFNQNYIRNGNLIVPGCIYPNFECPVSIDYCPVHDSVGNNRKGSIRAKYKIT